MRGHLETDNLCHSAVDVIFFLTIYFIIYIPALLSDVKPLRKNTSESGKSEQKTLAECSSFSNPGLESKLGENKGLIQGLESEVKSPSDRNCEIHE